MHKLAGITSVLFPLASAIEYNEQEKLINLPIHRLSSMKDIRDTLFPRKSTSNSGEVISIESEDDCVYKVNITIGTPPVSGYLLVLNESPDLFIYGQNCSTCDDDDIFYNPANSTSYVAGANQTVNLFNLDASTQSGFETVCLNSQDS